MDLRRHPDHRRRQMIVWDREIPVRSGIDYDFALHTFTTTATMRAPSSSSFDDDGVARRSNYRRIIDRFLNRRRILAFSSHPRQQRDGDDFEDDKDDKKRKFTVYNKPETSLGAPGLMDDYSVNLLDWSGGNGIALAVENTVYLRNCWDSSVSDLVTVEDDVGPVTSVSWAGDGCRIGVGFENSEVQLWDSNHGKLLRTLTGLHEGGCRVGSLAWNDGNNILTTGGADGLIVNHDIRARTHAIHTYRGHRHRRDICGLRWSLDSPHIGSDPGSLSSSSCPRLLASGGSDGLVHVWDVAMSSSSSSNSRQQWVFRFGDPRDTISGRPVRALAWCPYKEQLLATGDADGCIRFRCTKTGKCVKSVQAGSQVYALLWNKNSRALLSSCEVGFGSSEEEGQPQTLTLWEYGPPTLQIGKLAGHTNRVMYVSQSPDGCSVATASGGDDQMVRIWKIFPTLPAKPARPFAGSYHSYIRG